VDPRAGCHQRLPPLSQAAGTGSLERGGFDRWATAEHDIRRAPATYDRIIKNIAGQAPLPPLHRHGQMMKRPGY